MLKMSKIAGALSACMLLSPLAKAAKKEKDEGDDKHIFADREDIGIHLNEHVHRLMDVIDASDKLSLLYIFNSKITIDPESGQDWRGLDNMFVKVLEELKRGYVTTYAVDCAFEHADIDPKMNLM